ncbi:MAG: hypothetical protein AB8W21_00490 [Coxiella endosymbiont of Dermacentor silvarum]
MYSLKLIEEWLLNDFSAVGQVEYVAKFGLVRLKLTSLTITEKVCLPN